MVLNRCRAWHDPESRSILALATNLAAELVPERLRAPLVLVFTYDEEVGTLGARQLIESFKAGFTLPRNAVIGEPISLRVVRAHKGHLRLRVILHGRSAHSGYPHLDANAIELAGEVLHSLARLRRELERDEAPHTLLLDQSAPVHRYLCALVGQEIGTSVSYATDAGWLQRLGIDCAIWGPGSIAVAHRPSEYLLKSEVAGAHLLLEQVIDRFCVEVYRADNLIHPHDR